MIKKAIIAGVIAIGAVVAAHHVKGDNGENVCPLKKALSQTETDIKK